MLKSVFYIRTALAPVFFGTLIIAGVWTLWGSSKAATYTSLANPPGIERAAVQPLSASDHALYTQIFALQAAGKMKDADALVAKLDDRELMGHVLYKRYMHPTYKTSFEELRLWMTLYADHPEAEKIHGLATRRMPAGFKGTLIQPEPYKLIVAAQKTTAVKIYDSGIKRSPADKAALNSFNRQVLSLVADHKIDKAVEKLEKKSGTGFMNQAEYDQLQAAIAAEALYSGRTDRAYNLAKTSWKRSGRDVPMAGWVAGLAAWKKGQYHKAAEYFETTATSPYTPGWMVAGAWYWSGRARHAGGDIFYASSYKKAAEQPRTFYGLIATNALGNDFDFNWSVPAFSKKYYEILCAMPSGRRALGLAAVGQNDMAQAELLGITSRDADVRDALMSFAAYQGLPALAMRLSGGDTRSAFYDAASYPRNSMVPQGGYKIDPALIHAITHQESKFDPNAKSSKGATGLMQIMPSTANAMADQSDFSEGDYSLKDPRTNLALGQMYLKDLLGSRNVDGDIIALLVAYNAGPGNLARWKKQQDNVKDPLLFVETLPYNETRDYVRRVLANYWMYSLRSQSRVTTLEAIAKGQQAMYLAPDGDGYEFASRF